MLHKHQKWHKTLRTLLFKISFKIWFKCNFTLKLSFFNIFIKL